jgi:hypothetical protein
VITGTRSTWLAVAVLAALCAVGAGASTAAAAYKSCSLSYKYTTGGGNYTYSVSKAEVSGSATCSRVTSTVKRAASRRPIGGGIPVIVRGNFSGQYRRMATIEGWHTYLQPRFTAVKQKQIEAGSEDSVAVFRCTATVATSVWAVKKGNEKAAKIGAARYRYVFFTFGDDPCPLNKLPDTPLEAKFDPVLQGFTVRDLESTSSPGIKDGKPRRITTAHWDFGDGSSFTWQHPDEDGLGGGPPMTCTEGSEEEEPETWCHTYSAKGTYTITLTITAADGETATATRQVTIG